MKFEQGPPDIRASSVQPEASAEVTEAISEDLQPETSGLAPVIHNKVPKTVLQQAPRPVLQAADKPPKKRAKKAEHATPVANWDSDQSSQVNRLQQISWNRLNIQLLQFLRHTIACH